MDIVKSPIHHSVFGFLDAWSLASAKASEFSNWPGLGFSPPYPCLLLALSSSQGSWSRVTEFMKGRQLGSY